MSRSAASRLSALVLVLAVVCPGSLPAAAQATPAVQVASSAEASPAGGVPADASLAAVASADLRAVSLPAATPSAAARPARISIKVVPTVRAVTVTGRSDRPARALGRVYVQISRDKAFPRERTRTVRMTSWTRVLGALRNDQTFFVRLRSVRNGTVSGTSRVVQVVPTDQVPTGCFSTVRIAAAGTHRMRVAWSTPSAAQKFWIDVSYTTWGADRLRSASRNRFRVGPFPATTTSATVVIPPEFRRYIGSRTGNTAMVFLYVKNGENIRRVLLYGRPTPPAPQGTVEQKVSFGTYNVLGINGTVNLPGRTWAERRQKVLDVVRYAAVDVLGVQEVNQVRTVEGVEHYQDLAALLRPAGYSLAYDYDTVGPRGVQEQKDSHLFYRRSRIEVLDSGLVSVRSLNTAGRYLNGSGEPDLDRYMAWAKMRSRRSGAVFWVATVHLQAGLHPNQARSRADAMVGIERFLARKAGRAPVVVMGDLNDYIWDSSTGPDTYLNSKGWTSAAATRSLSGYVYPTVNDIGEDLFPPRPYMNVLGTVGYRIDHIFSKNASGSYGYANQLHLTPWGTFDERFRGSDHNLQKAVLSIR